MTFLLSPVALQAEGSSTASSGSQLAEGKGNQIGTVQPIPCLLSMPTRNHMDITTPPLPPVAPEVLRVAEHRHKKGLMYPYIFHVLTKVCTGLCVWPSSHGGHSCGVCPRSFRNCFLSYKVFEMKFIFPFLKVEKKDGYLYL